jgi:hypothetical protein
MVPFRHRLPHSISPLEGNGFELPVRGSGEAVCRPFFLRRLLGTGRRTGRRAAASDWIELGSYDIDRPTPLALIAARFEDQVHLAESLHRGQSAAGSEAPA